MSKEIKQYKVFRDQGLARYRFAIFFSILSITFIAIFPNHAGYVAVVLGALLIGISIKRIVDALLAFRAGYWQERAIQFGRLLTEYRGNKARIAALAYIAFNLVLIAIIYLLFVRSGVRAEFGGNTLFNR